MNARVIGENEGIVQKCSLKKSGEQWKQGRTEEYQGTEEKCSLEKNRKQLK